MKFSWLPIFIIVLFVLAAGAYLFGAGNSDKYSACLTRCDKTYPPDETTDFIPRHQECTANCNHGWGWNW